MNKFLIGVAVLLLCASISIAGSSIGNAIESLNGGGSDDAAPAVSNTKVLNLGQAAEYMNMSTEEIQGIIRTESDILEKTSSFSGKMFPYFTVDGNQYFYKDEIDRWLEEVSGSRLNYDTKEGRIW